jgi:hypothetical protein
MRKYGAYKLRMTSNRMTLTNFSSFLFFLRRTVKFFELCVDLLVEIRMGGTFSRVDRFLVFLEFA